jgi:cellulose synthase/poly-beta-1,6-N-acetylglucosamine synthase-like glycosyltransferase
MADLVIAILLWPPAILLALPAVCDLWAWLAATLRTRNEERTSEERVAAETPDRLLFLVPAHNEEQMIESCVRSLLAQRYPRDRLSVVVLADNCGDRTAARARGQGALVLERRSDLRGKHHAIAWALDRLPLRDHAAVVIIDADSVVDPALAFELARYGPLSASVVHCRTGTTNEFENWFTRVSALLTRSRSEVALPIKAAAGLSCPLTGNGAVLGVDVLREFSWRIETITEGWELYARYTLAGLRIQYAPEARLYEQEARSPTQSESQRTRWTAGRLAVLRRFGRAILTRPRIPLLQRLDLLAELSSLGSTMRGFLGAGGLLTVWLTGPAFSPVLAALFASSVLQPALYVAISLRHHPEPLTTLWALARLPLFVLWRVGVGFKAFLASGTGVWVRTERHHEGAPG